MPFTIRILTLWLLLAPGSGAASAVSDTTAAALADGLYAEIETPRGMLVAELFFERAPLTVTNFVGLAEGSLGPAPGTPFFDGLTFHRVAEGFVVQGGDPLGTGEGGPGYMFPDEFAPGLHHDAVGMLSMANSGPDTNGSQFFITLRPASRLNYLHSVFGKLVRGVELLPTIEQGDVMKVRILRQGDRARAFPADRAAFERLVAETPKALAPHFDDPDAVLPDPARARTYNQKLASFERFTGVKVYVRAFASLDPKAGDASATELASRLARRLAGASEGAVAVYLAESGEWAVALAENLRTRLAAAAGDEGTVEAFVRAMRAQAAAAAGPIGSERLPPRLRARLEIDAMVDGLIAALEPAP